MRLAEFSALRYLFGWVGWLLATASLVLGNHRVVFIQVGYQVLLQDLFFAESFCNLPKYYKFKEV
jgi:hypothetical protein